MRKTLYLKFLLAYFIFGFFGFVVVATFFYFDEESPTISYPPVPPIYIYIYGYFIYIYPLL